MTATITTSKPLRADYGVDAPAVMRNLFLSGGLCLLLGVFGPRRFTVGPVTVLLHYAFFWTAGFLLVEACLYLFYVKVGKLWHRDKMLSLIAWRGDEQVLDVGCGRGLLLIGAARHLTTGHATGIDLWSNVDMGGNSAEATACNLKIEGVAERCTIESVAAQDMTFTDGAFDVVVSNLCLHNIYDAPTRHAALRQIVRVLAPGGTAIISDYKLTAEYAKILDSAGLQVERRPLNGIAIFPLLGIVVARKSS